MSWLDCSVLAFLRGVVVGRWKVGRLRWVRVESCPSTKGRRLSIEMLNLMRVSVLSGGASTPEETCFSPAFRLLDEGMRRQQYGFRNLLDYNIKLHYLQELPHTLHPLLFPPQIKAEPLRIIIIDGY